jgi:hypothetical protein
MFTGYFLIFLIIIVSIGFNVWQFMSKGKLINEIDELKKQIKLMTKD